MPDGLMMMVPTQIMPMVKSPLFSWGTKIRMGPGVFPGAAGESAGAERGELMREHYGQETVDYLAEPLLSGVYGGSGGVERGRVLARFVAWRTSTGA